MKVLKLNLSLLLVAMMSLVFVSCEKNEKVISDVKTVYLKQAVYAGDIKYTGTEALAYSFETVEGITDADGKLAKSGILYNICLYSPGSTVVDASGVRAAAGTYEMDLRGVGNAMTVDGAAGASKCYLINIDETLMDTTIKVLYFTAGKVTVARVTDNNYRFDAELTDTEGNLHNIHYEGYFVATNNAPDPVSFYQTEPQTIEEKIYAANEIYVAVNYGDYFGLGVDDVIFGGVDEDWSVVPTIELMLPLGSGTAIPLGIYPIVSTRAANTAWASVGRQNEYFDMGCFVWDFQSAMDVYYIVSGTVTVTTEGFLMEGRSYYGSSITAVYEGSMELELYQPSDKPARQNRLIRR
ncbi:MAG: hypothetical protein LBT04_08945 [Prevotellaceae bacterium]|jgi:hypothetical protein|nr:hypothetical protein [Prevotellaceae bacterium]